MTIVVLIRRGRSLTLQVIFVFSGETSVRGEMVNIVFGNFNGWGINAPTCGCLLVSTQERIVVMKLSVSVYAWT